MDLSQFSTTIKKETLPLGEVKLLHKIDENADTNLQEILNFKMTEPERRFNLINF